MVVCDFPQGVLLQGLALMAELLPFNIYMHTRSYRIGLSAILEKPCHYNQKNGFNYLHLNTLLIPLASSTLSKQ
jgi:hypothetical protein